MTTSGRGPYTVYYWFDASETNGDKEQFDNVVNALSRAWHLWEQGGKPTHLIYDDAVLFSGNELTDVLRQISDNGGDSPSLNEAISRTLPNVLIEQLAKTVKFSHEYFGAVAVYRDLLEELYKAADEAIQNKNLGLLYTITSKLTFGYVPSESDVKQWGKDFLHAYRRDAGWLRDATKALEKIKTAAEKINATDLTNKELKEQIIKAAEKGLITHI